MTDNQPADSQPGVPSTRRLRARWIRYAVSLAILALTGVFLWRTIGHGGFKRLPAHLLAADPLLLGVAAVTNLCRYALWALRWRGIMSSVHRARLWHTVAALMGSIFVNTVVPGARPLGGIVRARILTRRDGSTPGSVYAATLVDQLGYGLVSMALGLYFLPRALMPTANGGRARVVQSVAMTVLLLLLATLFHPGVRRWIRQRLDERLASAARTVEGTVKAIPGLLARPTTWMWTLTLGPVVWLANALTIWIAGQALGATFGLSEAAAAWALGALAGAATGTPGGIGATEAFGSTVLIAGGTSAPLALAAMLLARVLHYVSALVIGGTVLLVHSRATIRADTGSTR